MASATDSARNLQSEYCGICWNYCSPFVSMDCGHVVCPECFFERWTIGSTPLSCPKCSHVSQIRLLPARNVNLENLADFGGQFNYQELESPFRQGPPLPDLEGPQSPDGKGTPNPEGQGPQSPDGQGTPHPEGEGHVRPNGKGPPSPEGQGPSSPESQENCPIHKKLLQFFCEQDETLLCVSCCQTSEHRGHKLSHVEEAVDNYKEKFQEILNHLEKDFEEVEKLLWQQEVETPPIDWGWMISEEYDKLQCFLKEEEFCCLEGLKQEHRTTKKGLSCHIQTLQKIRREIDESNEKYNIDLLEGVGELLGRSESVMEQRPNAVSRELRQYPIPGMLTFLNKFRVDIRLDPESDRTFVTISEDLKSIQAGEVWEVEQNQSEDSIYHYVFGEQFFTSGRHYWEVDVTQVPQWGLGVYTPYLSTGMGRNVCSRESMFLLQCLKKGDQYNLQTYPASLNHHMKEPVPRIGVYLEYSVGEILFFNVLQHSLIYRFGPIPFSYPVSPVFSPGPPLPGIKWGPMTICSLDSHLCACCYSAS